jgi:hypothetical protein
VSDQAEHERDRQRDPRRRDQPRARSSLAGRVGRHDRYEHGWGDRVHKHPDVELSRGGEPTLVHATFIDDAPTIDAVAAAFSEKYGWVDWWFGLVVRKDPMTVRLDPRPPAG